MRPREFPLIMCLTIIGMRSLSLLYFLQAFNSNQWCKARCFRKTTLDEHWKLIRFNRLRRTIIQSLIASTFRWRSAHLSPHINGSLSSRLSWVREHNEDRNRDFYPNARWPVPIKFHCNFETFSSRPFELMTTQSYITLNISHFFAGKCFLVYFL